MCDPVTASVALAVTAVAGTTANVISQAKAANAQEKAIRNQMAAAREETRDAASAELFDQMRATRREQARIRTAAGEAGLALSSGSVAGLLLDSAMQGELRRDRTLANTESRHRANTAEAESMLSHVQKPTALSAGLQIASSAAGGWAQVRTAKLEREQSGRG